MSLRRQLERYGRWLAVIATFAAVATACALYILLHERVPLPFQDRYAINVELTDVAGLTPGLGQPVNVAGVRVGEVGRISLHDGRARVRMAIDPAKLPAVYADATAALQARTPLKDLQIELAPGSPPARRLPDGATIPASRTSVPVDSDELLRVLDGDTRAYLQSLMTSASQGLGGRGRDLRAILRGLGPTDAQLRRITALVARRRTRVARLVSNLTTLARTAGSQSGALGELLRSGDRTLAAVGGQDAALDRALQELPGALSATRAALPRVRALADDVAPSVRALRPALRALPAGLAGARTLAGALTPLLREDARPLLRTAAPILRHATPAVTALSAATPLLTNTVRILRYAVDELAYNPPGERDEGFLYWLAWTAHNVDSILSVDDAHGATVRSSLLIGCESLTQGGGLPSTLLTAIAGVAPVCHGG